MLVGRMSCGYGSNLHLREFTAYTGVPGGWDDKRIHSGGKPSKTCPGAHSPAQPQRPGTAQVGATTMT